MSFQETYRSIAENLLQRPLTEADGFPVDDIEAGTATAGGQLPAALREYYGAIGQIDFNKAHNRLIDPNELAVAEDSEFLAIIEENQLVCSWSIKTADLGEDDPTVFCIQAGDPEPHSEECSLSEFLVISMYLQCCWGGLQHNLVNKRAKKFMPKIRTSWNKVVDHSGLIIWEHEGMLVSDMEESFVLGAVNTEVGFKTLVKDHGFKVNKV